MLNCRYKLIGVWYRLIFVGGNGCCFFGIYGSVIIVMGSWVNDINVLS